MSLIDSFRKGYPVTTECSNCLTIQEINVPKGLTIEEFMGRETARCKYCGCSNTLRKIPTRKVEKEAERKSLFKKNEKNPFRT